MVIFCRWGGLYRRTFPVFSNLKASVPRGMARRRLPSSSSSCQDIVNLAVSYPRVPRPFRDDAMYPQTRHITTPSDWKRLYPLARLPGLCADLNAYEPET